MDIAKNLEESILTLALSGDFDTTETEYFAAEIQEAVDAGNLRVLLDLADLEFINSTALGTLLRCQKLLAQYGGELAAARAREDVRKTFRILQLDRRIPNFEDLESAIDHLKSIAPAGVPAAGEDVKFTMPGREETLGERPRLAKLEEIDEDAMAIAFENLEGIDPEAAFPADAGIDLEFRLPLYHPTHVFHAKGVVERFELLGRETVLVRVRLTDLPETEREAIRQYVKDLRFLKDD